MNCYEVFCGTQRSLSSLFSSIFECFFEILLGSLPLKLWQCVWWRHILNSGIDWWEKKELYRDMRKCLFSWYSSIYGPMFGIIFWNKTRYSGNGQQASLSRSCWVFGFMEASYRGSHLTSKTSAYKKHTQTAPQRYTHSKSLAKIDILQALRLPSADKHYGLTPLTLPGIQTLFRVSLPSNVNVLSEASHQERQCGFERGVWIFSSATMQ